MPASSFLWRPQPIRNAILAYLSEPRSAQAIARHINRPVPTATGHLAAMRRLGLVVRLGYAAYARADYAGPPLSFYRKPRDRRKPPRDLPVSTAPAPFAKPGPSVTA